MILPKPRPRREGVTNNPLVTVTLLFVGMLMVAACGGGDGPSSTGQNRQNQNQAPTANAGNDEAVGPGETVTLDGAGSRDPGGSIASYSWVQVSPDTPPVAITNANGARATFIAPTVTQDTEFEFRLTVTDNSGLAARATVTITIEASGDSGGTVYQPGVFPPFEQFHNVCEFPRDRGERGALADDKSGTAVDEKNFLRSYIHDTYLWYDEVEDIDPNDARYSVQGYFARMIISDQSFLGRPRDRFSGSVPTEPWQQLIDSGTAAGYGFESHMTILNGEIVILHVEPGSPADQNGLSRGARIVSVEGVELASEIDPFEFLYPRGVVTLGSTFEFEVRDLGSTTTRTFSMGLDEYVVEPVQYTRVLDTDTGPVGYIFFNTHDHRSEQQLIEAFEELAEAEVTDLVLDMRYNGGGYDIVAAEVASMIASPSAASGKVFLRPQFNDKHPTHNPISGEPIEPLYFPTTAHGLSAQPDTPLPNLNLNRVFVLATSRTCSASELIINGLRGIDVEVILIGDTTCGKPYGFQAMDNCGTTYFVVQIRAINDKGFGEYEDGFVPENGLISGPFFVAVPGCAVADDAEHALGDVNEALLAAALGHRSGADCPARDRVAMKPATPWSAPHKIDFMLMR